MTVLLQLPWFIRDPGVHIIGQECYTSLVENLNVTDVHCLKYSLSKGLGIGIVAGGSIMKVPQVLLIVKARSARGISLPSYILETTAYGINLLYSFRQDYAFSTYGENFFLTIQNILITLLIICYAPRSPSKNSQLAMAVAAIASGLFILCTVPLAALSFLQLCTLPLSLLSKLPQIRQNHRSKSTGQLSVFAVASQVVGCLARLFTTATEVGDPLVAASFGLALVLNMALGFQLWLYWGQDDGKHDYELRIAPGRAPLTLGNRLRIKAPRKDASHLV
ncbi:mannose-P-dolichol utilization defect 1 protein [Mycena floridula]|nr:mannose-P-dolichol utilization defect 1 protein [Mycena floridula]